jgi:hypothetical protein
MVVYIAWNSACARYVYPILACIAASVIVVMMNYFEKMAKMHRVVFGSDTPLFVLLQRGRYDRCLANDMK